jgi:hypothetical protein
MVLFYLFHKKIHSVNFFVKKHGVFRPAGGDIRHQTRDRLIYGSIGRFAVFAHIHKLRGAPSNRTVTPMEAPIRLRQHGTFFIFFTKIWLCEPNFREKAWGLPPCRRRIPAGGWMTA